MADDPLYAPLGLDPPPPRRNRRLPGRALAVLVMIVAGAGIGAAYLDRTRKPATDAVVVSTIQAAAPQPEPAPPPAPPEPKPAPPPAPPAAAPIDPSLFAPGLVTTPPAGSSVEVQNGVRIVRLNPATSPASVTVPVDGGPAAALARAPDPRVSETVADGTLPRIGKDGSRPAVVYARPAEPGDGPKVALVALGAGRDQLGSAEAARRLPGAIDFALPPDAPDVRTQAAEMRREGREVVLDLGTGTPGDAAALRKAMAAWAGYVGMVLPAGADDAVRQAGERGLIAVQPGRDADLIADATDPAALAAAMARLAGVARAKGAAVGLVGNAIAGRDALAQAAERLAAQGVTLVPLSALGPRPDATAAR